VCSRPEVDAFFDPKITVDLYYDVILPKTDWPTRDYSIKTLASYLGFVWRDSQPLGAASIEWYCRWTEAFEPSYKQRILEYNEDDCRATRVVADAVHNLSALPPNGLC
jgi:predicted RecB family nuclease